MAPAQAASASTGTDSIKGLAQSVAKPAYRRLLVAEPALRRAVPILIIAFLVTMAVGAMVQISDHRRQAVAGVTRELQTIADLVARAPRSRRQSPQAEMLPAARKKSSTNVAPQYASDGRRFLVTDADGNVIATAPKSAALGQGLLNTLGSAQPLTTFGVRAGVLEITLNDGDTAFATVRISRPRSARSRSCNRIVRRSRPGAPIPRSPSRCSATTGFVVLILGFAFHWQATRAREADTIYDMVRGRIDTALNRGRCGLWDWDIARGRIFWSHSMFEILGLEAAQHAADVRRTQRVRASRRRRSLSISRREVAERQDRSPSTTNFACATPRDTGSGCGRAAK